MNPNTTSSSAGVAPTVRGNGTGTAPPCDATTRHEGDGGGGGGGGSDGSNDGLKAAVGILAVLCIVFMSASAMLYIKLKELQTKATNPYRVNPAHPNPSAGTAAVDSVHVNDPSDPTTTYAIPTAANNDSSV